MGYIYDAVTDHSELAILDAQTLQDRLCRQAIPQRSSPEVIACRSILAICSNGGEPFLRSTSRGSDTSSFPALLPHRGAEVFPPEFAVDGEVSGTLVGAVGLANPAVDPAPRTPTENWPNNVASLARLSDEWSRNFAMQVLLYQLPAGDCASRGRPMRLLTRCGLNNCFTRPGRRLQTPPRGGPDRAKPRTSTGEWLSWPRKSRLRSRLTSRRVAHLMTILADIASAQARILAPWL